MRKSIILLLCILIFLVPFSAFATSTPEYVQVRELVEFTVERNPNPALGSNITQNIVRAGENGIIEVVYKLNYQDGKEISREKIASVLIKQMVPQIEEYGTGVNAPEIISTPQKIQNTPIFITKKPVPIFTSVVVNTPNPNKKVPIPATLNQKLATRSGPSTAYDELGTYPKDTQIVVFQQEWGNKVPWGLVEIEYRGGKYRLYTGMKRIDCDRSLVPWGNQSPWTMYVTKETRVYYGPGADYAARKYPVSPGTVVEVFDEENGFAICDLWYSGYFIRGYIPKYNLGY